MQFSPVWSEVFLLRKSWNSGIIYSEGQRFSFSLQNVGKTLKLVQYENDFHKHFSPEFIPNYQPLNMKLSKDGDQKNSHFFH